MKHVLVFILFTLLSGIWLVSCSKDDISDEKSFASSIRSSSATLNIEYSMRKITKVEPEDGDLQDMCIGDVRMLQKPAELHEVESYTDRNGDLCTSIRVKKERVPNTTLDPRNKVYDKVSETTICDGKLTYTTSDTTIVKSNFDQSDLDKFIVKGHMLSDSTLRQSFEITMDSLRNANLVTEEDSLYMTITETSANGQSVVTIMSKSQMVPVFTRYIDANGQIQREMTYTYRCIAQKELVPLQIYIESWLQSYICDTPVKISTWMIYDEYNISKS